MATYKERIEELIGTEMAEIASSGTNAIFDNAVRSVCGALRMQFIYEQGGQKPEELGVASYTVTDKLVVHVERDDGNVLRACTPVDAGQFRVSSDANSIYKATTFTPVYSLINSNAGGVATLGIYPAPTVSQKAYIHHVDFAAIASDEEPMDGDQVLDALGLYASTLAGVPITANQAIIYKAASDYLLAYLNEAIQEDEDAEITQLINSQISVLKSSYMEELQRLGTEVSTEVK